MLETCTIRNNYVILHPETLIFGVRRQAAPQQKRAFCTRFALSLSARIDE